MRYKNSQLYFKAEDVRNFTGLTDGQIYAARNRGDLDPVQFVTGGDCYYQPDEILAIHRRILSEGKVGSASLRRNPVISYKGEYYRAIRSLRKDGFSVEDVATLIRSDIGAGWDVDYRPELAPDDAVNFTDIKIKHKEAARDQKFTEQATRPQQTLEGKSEEKITFSMPKADILPFDFKLGHDTPPTLEDDQTVQEEFELVKGCFGFFDETNPECSENCAFKNNCAVARMNILSAFARQLEGEDVDVEAVQQEAIAEYESRI